MTNHHLDMQFRIFAFVLCSCFSVKMTAADEDSSMAQSSVYAVANQTIRLSCPLQRSKTARIGWFDFVYNQEHDPKKIFSAVGQNRTLERDHPNSANYDIDANFTLIIRDLRIDDSGAYMCTSRINQTRTLVKSYYLAVTGFPSCSGTSNLTAGQNASFSCEASYSGNVYPRLEWRRGQDEVLRSSFNDEIRLAKKAVDFEASAGDDGMTFSCRMTFGNVVAECNVNLTVFYSVRDLVLDPLKETYSVGEELRCSANGNPTPDVSIMPDLDTGKTGVGWISVTIPKSLDGKKAEVECTASNTVNGQTESIAKSISFMVDSGAVATVEPETPNPVRTESASSSGAIVGGIVVGIMILVIVVAAVFFLRLRKEKKPKKEENGGSKATAITKDAPQQTNQREQQV